MTDDPGQDAILAGAARHVLGYLKRHGGSLRIAPLVRNCGLDFDVLATALNELAERRWVKIAFRKPRAVMPPDLPERCRTVERITLTRVGRWRHAATWPER
jgi:hypothetical protein